MTSVNRLYDSSTGGCHDGLQEGRVNENQGAESTLAFLMSLAEMEQFENSLEITTPPKEVLRAPANDENKALRLVHAD